TTMSTVCVPRLRGYRGVQPAQISALALVMILFVTIPKAQAGPALPQCPGCMLPTDEIQVYDAAITEVGQWNLTWHQNYTPQAQSVPDFPGGVVPDHALNGVPEWAYGLRPWLELGLYMPIYSYTARGRLLFDGFKLRQLFVVPHAEDRTFFYGVNFEWSYNEPQWDAHRISGEMRPIIGTHLGPWDLIVNPVLDTDFDGFKNLTFAPEARVAYNFSPKLALAAEWYGEFGAVSDVLPTPQQGQNLFAVVDLGSSSHGIEFGVGHGYTPGSSPLIFKLMLMQDF
ncbi:MAG: hypothetical protein ACRET0_12805, partial [Steroidobacteraceae bacterium]